MKLNISHRFIIISVLPVLIIAVTLSAYFLSNHFSHISNSLNKHGVFITKQLSPAAVYAIYSGNIELIKPIVNTVIKDESVVRVQIQDNENNNILDIKKNIKQPRNKSSIFENLFNDEKQLIYSEAVISEQLPVDDFKSTTENMEDNDNTIGQVIVTLSTRQATAEKISHVKYGIVITLIVVLITIVIIIRISKTITQPIKSLTDTVRQITSGHLDAKIEKGAAGEIGILQSCIIHMTEELKHSQSDMENQLSEYTLELQETMEELEIRNAELDITRAKAIYANNAKSEFLANMSHEIRTPLSGIIGFTELLQNTSLSNQQKDYAATIQKSSANLLEIINDILDLSKIESGKTEITTSEFNVINVIEDIINLLSTTAMDKKVELFYCIEKDVPGFIKSDPFRIHQILTNLIGNAIKFTDKGYVYLQVSKGDIENTEASIKFSVSDTGIGMDSNDEKKLFKAFSQADTSITRRFGGTGLGLTISQKLVLLMKGEIGFDSTKNKGSTFWFSIPVTPIQQEITKSDLADKKIAFFSNHDIATQAFKTHFENADCLVSEYTYKDLRKLSDIENKNDIIIIFLSSKEISNDSISEHLNSLSFSKPSLLIASTLSHKKIRNLQQHIFDSAVFTSEKIEHIKQRIINTINRKTAELDYDIPEANLDPVTDWSSINIMVVDDNEVNLRLAQIILHNHKAKVIVARSGRQALDYACLNSFDIIFMDLHMPGLDGYETTKKIRETVSGKQPVIIALTANALSSDTESIVNAGMNGTVIKPVSDAMLKKVINQWLLQETSDISALSSYSTYEAKPGSQNEDNKQDDKNKKIFSIDLAKEFTGNNETLAYELFGMLRAELNNYSEAILLAMKNNNLTELYAQAHKLHGASRCCGTTELKETSSHIENLINKKINFDIKKETQALLSAIKNLADFKIE